MNIFIILLLFLYKFSAITIFSAENGIQPKTFEIGVKFGRLNANSLVYCDPEYVDYCRSNGILCNYNEPFLSTEYELYQFRPIDREVAEAFRKLTHLPLSLLYDNNEVKKVNTSLFIFTKHTNSAQYALDTILQTDFEGRVPDTLVNTFRQNYKCMLGGQFQNGELLAFVDIDPVEEKLLKKGILAKVGDEIVHGPKGYFGSAEYYKKVWQYRKKIFFNVGKGFIGLGALGVFFYILTCISIT